MKKHNKRGSFGVVVRSGAVTLDRFIFDMLLFEEENNVTIKTLHIGVTHTDESLRQEWLNSERKSEKMQRVIDRMEGLNFDILKGTRMK